MDNKKQLSLEEILELEPPHSHFELQAYQGATKHLGGLKVTNELIELCHINKDKYVLDVGCGVGVTSCYIAKRNGCRVVGVDISERMIDRSNERAKREGVENMVEFKVADAQSLPFEHALFDAVIGESITTFLEDKQKAVKEYIRVLKPEGYVGLNEETWIETSPPAELVEYLYRTMKAEIPTSDGWKEFLEGSGLSDIVVKIYKINVLSEFVNRIRQLGLNDFLRSLYGSVSLYIVNPAVRKFLKKRLPPPKNIFEYLGCIICVGKK